MLVSSFCAGKWPPESLTASASYTDASLAIAAGPIQQDTPLGTSPAEPRPPPWGRGPYVAPVGPRLLPG